MFTPIDLSAFYCRRFDVLRQAFSLVAEYLRTGQDEVARNYMDYGVQLGRRFRALKLWMVVRYFGREGLVARLREHLRLAQQLAGWIDADPDFERLAPVPFSTVCFRARPGDLIDNVNQPETEQYLDSLNEALLEAVNRTGQAYLSHTRLRGKLTLRLAIGHLRTTEEHIARAWTLLREQAGKLDHERRPAMY
jgi:aromatic-L-amino-acid decarboxylase